MRDLHFDTFDTFDTFDAFVEPRMTEQEWTIRVKVLPVQWETNRNDRSIFEVMHRRASVLTVLEARKGITSDWSKFHAMRLYAAASSPASHPLPTIIRYASLYRSMVFAATSSGISTFSSACRLLFTSQSKQNVSETRGSVWAGLPRRYCLSYDSWPLPISYFSVLQKRLLLLRYR